MELKAPIRIYWDLPSLGPVGEICEQILALRVLALDLSLDGMSVPSELSEILERLKGEPVAITITLAPELFLASADILSRYRIRGLLLSVSSFTRLKESLGAFATGADLPDPGLSFPVGEGNYREIPETLSFCLEKGIRRVVFPIQRAQGPLFSFTPHQREELEIELRKRGLPGALQLTVHDPFLWKAINPSLPFPENGCQAANSMLYVAPDAAVYPCPILPYPLGTLTGATLPEILSSAVKKELREKLLAPPEGCLPCPELPGCLGGCRGRGYFRRGFGGADPSCGRPFAEPTYIEGETP